MDQVGVMNMALGHLAQTRIVSATEGSVASKCMSFWWEIVCDQVLIASDWSFTSYRRALSSITNDRSAEWDYCYDIPNDCLAFKRIIDPNRPTLTCAHTLANGKIYTSIQNAVGLYTVQNYNPTQWSPGFARAVSYLLAAEAAMELTKKATLRDKLMKEYEGVWLPKAVAEDATQNLSTWDSGNAYVEARVDGDMQQSAWDSPGPQVDGSTIWE